MADFAAAFAQWRIRESRLGPVHAYGAALRLRDLAKGSGDTARAQAAWAVGSTLFWRGRFADARRCLPASEEGLACLGWALALQGEHAAARAQPLNAMLHFFLDEAQACLSCLGKADAPVAAAYSELLRHWARARLGESVEEAAAHAALASLHRLSPCDAARGLAIHAEAAFHAHPAYALPHLDHALDRFAHFGLHHLEAQLLARKASALAAAGLLNEADRFERVAQEAAKRHR